MFATFVASLAHTVGGGAPPGPVAIAVALALSTPLAMLVTGARTRLVRAAIAALVAQAALHLCYALGSASPTSAAPGLAGHGGHVAPLATGGLQLPVSVDHGHAWMPLAHALAAAATVAVLVVVDRAFAAIARVVREVVRRLTPIHVRVEVRLLRVPMDAGPRRPVGAMLASATGSRGPPVGAVAA